MTNEKRKIIEESTLKIIEKNLEIGNKKYILHFQDNLYNFLVILYSVFSSFRSNLLCKPESNNVIIK